jgi:hypothetical protein
MDRGESIAGLGGGVRTKHGPGLRAAGEAVPTTCAVAWRGSRRRIYAGIGHRGRGVPVPPGTYPLVLVSVEVLEHDAGAR